MIFFSIRFITYVLLGRLPFPAVAAPCLVSHQVPTAHRVVPRARLQAVRVAHLYVWHAHVRPHHCAILGSRQKIFLTTDLVSRRMLPSDSQDVQSQVSFCRFPLCACCWSCIVAGWATKKDWDVRPLKHPTGISEQLFFFRESSSNTVACVA